jgi:calcyphosin
MTPAEVYREFLETFDVGHNGKVNMKTFLEYYENVSSSIDNDDYFELCIRNAWHIAGGQVMPAFTVV